MNGQQMLKRDFVGDLAPREGKTRRATALAATTTRSAGLADVSKLTDWR